MGRTLFYCADVKTRVSSFWGFTKRELSKNRGSPEPSVQSKIRLSLANCPKKRAMSSKWDSTFSFVKEHGFSFFFLSRVGKISFFIVKDLGNLLFSVSRLWKISLFDYQVLWVQYKSTSMIYKRTIIGINFWNENAKKNPMFLKKKLKILWRGNRSLTNYLIPKICRSTLLASIGII